MAVVPNAGKHFVFKGKEWICVKTEVNGDFLAITAVPWRHDRFDDADDKSCTNNFANATIRKLLNYTFLASLDIDTRLLKRFYVELTADNGDKNYGFIKDYVTILSFWELKAVEKYLNIPNFMWTRTPLRCIGIGDKNVSIVDTNGRWGHCKANCKNDIYPVLFFKHQTVYEPGFKVDI